MDDQNFTELRNALAPGRELTARLGALVVLHSMLDDDPRIVSLCSTLLREPADPCDGSDPYDGSDQLAAAVAAMVSGSPLEGDLMGELQQAWTYRSAAYRSSLVLVCDASLLSEFVEVCLQSGQSSLKLALLSRLGDLRDSDQRLEAVSTLAGDLDPEVRSRAIRAAQNARKSADHEFVAPLVRRQVEMIEKGEFNQAMTMAAQVLMRVADHAECQYHMARATAGLGDHQRAVRLLRNSVEGGFADRAAAEGEPLFEPLRDLELWAELFGNQGG